MLIIERPLPKLILLAWLLFLPLPIHAQQVLNDQALVEALRKGGYILYFRHEATNWSQQDIVQDKGDWLSCEGTSMRQLSELGRQRAKSTGESIRRLRVPVSEVVASPYCRTIETARQMSLGEVQASSDVINLRVAEYFGGREAVIATARRLLALMPDPGRNRVIVAHGNVAQAATPVYPGEGEMVVFKPDGKGSFIYVGRLTPDQLIRLSQEN
jgi:phosphohistidine phosphatase SixA